MEFFRNKLSQWIAIQCKRAASCVATECVGDIQSRQLIVVLENSLHKYHILTR